MFGILNSFIVALSVMVVMAIVAPVLIAAESDAGRLSGFGGPDLFFDKDNNRPRLGFGGFGDNNQGKNDGPGQANDRFGRYGFWDCPGHGEREIPECGQDIDCGDGLQCNGIETCVAGKCVAGIAVDCSINDILAVDTCTNDPDANPLTWDTRIPFVSQCVEGTETYTCSQGDQTITHVCGKNCQGACVSDSDCDDRNEGTTDSCDIAACQCAHIEIIPDPQVGNESNDTKAVEAAPASDPVATIIPVEQSNSSSGQYMPGFGPRAIVAQVAGASTTRMTLDEIAAAIAKIRAAISSLGRQIAEMRMPSVLGAATLVNTGVLDY